ncbi:MAG: sugar transferase [Chloroflexota bacterium]
MQTNVMVRQFDTKSSNILNREGNMSLQRNLPIWRWRFTIAFRSIYAKSEPYFKRYLDLMIASFALIGLLPVLILTAIAVKLESPGPIIFRQTRVGKRGKLFTCYKFRSMSVDAEARKAELMAQNEADGPVFKMQNDPRITLVGAVIRKLSIDELPQLVNVLRGDMSIVGPRPSLPQEVEQYKFHQLRRLEAIPGLTGLQQVSGRSNLDFEQWIHLDLQYIAEQNIWCDIWIICKTVPAVLLSRGAY